MPLVIEKVKFQDVTIGLSIDTKTMPLVIQQVVFYDFSDCRLENLPTIHLSINEISFYYVAISSVSDTDAVILIVDEICFLYVTSSILNPARTILPAHEIATVLNIFIRHFYLCLSSHQKHIDEDSNVYLPFFPYSNASKSILTNQKAVIVSIL